MYALARWLNIPTVDNYATMKTWILGIADKEKDVHEANKS
jgi:hypothetical protein